ncbi:MAG: type II toxin-antitoxin system death-on-curing family toxin [Woeseiaceae bacterium]|uniref:type II toxin-antitoxin system death-on-curing family toxin n=1 Tax=Eudoraea sp. TaxID=1979955 RepID=UPI003C769FB3
MPANTVDFLSLDEVLAIHERLFERFGGDHGVRDRGLLESALFRPQTGYYAHVEEMAAAMFESLLVNHAFVDGNKRVAFFATDIFLRLNGWKLLVSADEGEHFIIEMLEANDRSFEDIRKWIQAHISTV